MAACNRRTSWPIRGQSATEETQVSLLKGLVPAVSIEHYRAVPPRDWHTVQWIQSRVISSHDAPVWLFLFSYPSLQTRWSRAPGRRRPPPTTGSPTRRNRCLWAAAGWRTTWTCPEPSVTSGPRVCTEPATEPAHMNECSDPNRVIRRHLDWSPERLQCTSVFILLHKQLSVLIMSQLWWTLKMLIITASMQTFVIILTEPLNH